jgi:hypothetical protein
LHKHHNREIIARLEVSYHYWHNVGVNENFYNKAKQTSVGFSNEGVVVSQETRDKISKAVKGKNNPNWGKEVSQTTREKIGKSNRGKETSQETKDKIGKARKGRKHSQEFKDNMSKTKQGTVSCRDLITGECKRIKKEEFDNNPLLVGSRSKKPNIGERMARKNNTDVRKDLIELIRLTEEKLKGCSKFDKEYYENELDSFKNKLEEIDDKFTNQEEGIFI